MSKVEIISGDYCTECCIRSEISATEKALNKRGYTVVQMRQAKNRFYICGVKNKPNGADYMTDRHTR